MHVNGHAMTLKSAETNQFPNTLDHCMENMKVTVVKKLTSLTNHKEREILEQKFIHKFNCINQGLNRDYAFMSYYK